MRRRFAVALGFGLLLASTSATASPTHIETDEPRLICTPLDPVLCVPVPGAGAVCVPMVPPAKCRPLPPGHFVDTPGWVALDAEIRRAQNAETRLAAENQSLRKSAAAWSPGWRTLALALLTGAAGGWYVHSLF